MVKIPITPRMLLLKNMSREKALLLDKILEDPERVYRGRKDIHNEIYEKLKEKNLPEPEVKYKVYIREVATGFKLLGVDKGVVDPYIESLRCDFYEYIKNIVGTYIVDRVLYRHLGLQRVLSRVHKFEDAPYILFADFLVISKSNWVIEGKKKLNYEAIGKVLVYKHLLEMDYPELGDIKMGIACFESDKRLERICEELNIEVFVLK